MMVCSLGKSECLPRYNLSEDLKSALSLLYTYADHSKDASAFYYQKDQFKILDQLS